MRLSCLLVLVLLLLHAAPAALGCPVCDTATGEQVRAGILGDRFAFNLFATLLPFPFLIGIVALIHFGPPKGKS